MDNQDKYIKQLKETLGVIDKDNQNMQKEKIYLKEKINNLQQRIEKAVEYIENDLQISVLPNNQIINGKEVVKRINKIINILKGDDTNE